MKTEDLRVVKSKKSIRTAFLELMKEKDYQSITVKDIAQKAMINRKTFYFHYETKEALYNEMANEVTSIIKPVEILNDIQSSEKEGQRKILHHLLKELKKHTDVCSVFLNNTNPAFSNMLKIQLSDALLSKTEIIKRTQDTGFTFEFLLDTYYAIFQIILKWWLNSDETDPQIAIDNIFKLFSKEPLKLLGIKYD